MAICFNGAALTEARKPEELVVDLQYLLDASMGPRSQKRGNNRSTIEAGINHGLLQWGRAHRSAETPRQLLRTLPLSRLQWGRAHRSAETGDF